MPCNEINFALIWFNPNNFFFRYIASWLIDSPEQVKAKGGWHRIASSTDAQWNLTPWQNTHSTLPRNQHREQSSLYREFIITLQKYYRSHLPLYQAIEHGYNIGGEDIRCTPTISSATTNHDRISKGNCCESPFLSSADSPRQLCGGVILQEGERRFDPVIAITRSSAAEIIIFR